MKIANNTIEAVKHRFREKLSEIYPAGEIDQIFMICVEHFLQMSKTDYLLQKRELLSESQLLQFVFALDELAKHKPVQHITGTAWFMDMELLVSKDTLVPRQETEELVHWVLEGCGDKDVLDIGTGSGCIALALKKKCANFKIDALDISEESLEMAQKNATKERLQVNFSCVDILSESLQNKYDIIISNPPYIPERERSHMNENVLKYDPEGALFVPDNDPLLFYRRIGALALKFLKDSGVLYFEIHEDFGAQTKELLQLIGFKVVLKKDINGKDRMIKATL